MPSGTGPPPSSASTTPRDGSRRRARRPAGPDLAARTRGELGPIFADLPGPAAPVRRGAARPDISASACRGAPVPRAPASRSSSFSRCCVAVTVLAHLPLILIGLGVWFLLSRGACSRAGHGAALVPTMVWTRRQDHGCSRYGWPAERVVTVSRPAPADGSPRGPAPPADSPRGAHREPHSGTCLRHRGDRRADRARGRRRRIGTAAADADGKHRHDLDTYKREAWVELLEHPGFNTLHTHMAVRPGDYALDGMWKVDAHDGDDRTVAAPRSPARDVALDEKWHYELGQRRHRPRPGQDSSSPASTPPPASATGTPTTSRSQRVPSHSDTQPGVSGETTLTAACSTGEIPVSPSFDVVAPSDARLVESYPSGMTPGGDDPVSWTWVFLGSVAGGSITTTIYCVDRQTSSAGVPAHTHRVDADLIEETVTLDLPRAVGDRGLPGARPTARRGQRGCLRHHELPIGHPLPGRRTPRARCAGSGSPARSPGPRPSTSPCGASTSGSRRTADPPPHAARRSPPGRSPVRPAQPSSSSSQAKQAADCVRRSAPAAPGTSAATRAATSAGRSSPR